MPGFWPIRKHTGPKVIVSTGIMGGCQRDWSSVGHLPDQPVITIITSTFNAAAHLPWTLASIREQTYPYIQWIVADGASTDGTTGLLEQNEDIIDIWFSEPDSGIYDAWNKALKYAKGQWVQFIGAGDELASMGCIEHLALTLARAHPEHDLVYGKVQMIRESDRQAVQEKGCPWASYCGKWTFFRPALPPHPGVFHHISLFGESCPFDTRFKIAADSHFLLKSAQNKRPLFVDYLVDRMPLGGVSGSIQTDAMARETKLVAIDLGLRAPFLHRLHEHIKLIVKHCLLRFLPTGAMRSVANLYHHFKGDGFRW